MVSPEQPPDTINLGLASLSRYQRLKYGFIHSPQFRRKAYVWMVVYFLIGCALIAYVSLQASRINKEVAVRTNYQDMSNITFPGMVICHSPDLSAEYFALYGCVVTSGFTPAKKDCLPFVKPVTVVTPELSPNPNDKCFALESGKLVLHKGESITTVFFCEVSKRMFTSSLLFFSLFDGKMPQKVNLTGESVSNAQTMVKVEMSMVKDIDSDTYRHEYAASTVTLPYRHNYTIETAEENRITGGLSYEIAIQSVFFNSYRVKILEFYYTYTLMDFLGQFGGILGMAGTILAFILGPGDYDPRGLVHKIHVVKDEDEVENQGIPVGVSNSNEPGVSMSQFGSQYRRM